jgi:hypothetical protein
MIRTGNFASHVCRGQGNVGWLVFEMPMSRRMPYAMRY